MTNSSSEHVASAGETPPALAPRLWEAPTVILDGLTLSPEAEKITGYQRWLAIGGFDFRGQVFPDPAGDDDDPERFWWLT